jgi:hypothetical protein
MRKLLLVAFSAIVVYVSVTTAADTLPERLSDKDFWELSVALSEPAGIFLSENVLSNESGFPFLIPELQRKAGNGGVYLGVGPEQNFSYIAGLQPSMAFIIDIRRENLIEHLLYKALFELSADRIDFVSRLFSRARPRGLSPRATARELLNAVMSAPVNDREFQTDLEKVEGFLRQQGFALTPEEMNTLEHLHSVFRDFGPRVDYLSTGRMPGGRMDNMPTYADLMTETDASGRERSYLSDEKSFQFVQDLQKRNLIVPVVGDFGGPKAIRAVGRYLRDHQAVVTTFYVSNVEAYLFRSVAPGNPNGGAVNFYNNVRALPLTASSTFVRSIPLPTGRGDIFGWQSLVTASIQQTIKDMDAGALNAYPNLFLPR